MKSIVGVRRRGKGCRRARVQETEQTTVVEGITTALSSRVELIQALIPLGLEAVGEVLQQEVTALTGARYQRGNGQPG